MGLIEIFEIILDEVMLIAEENNLADVISESDYYNESPEDILNSEDFTTLDLVFWMHSNSTPEFVRIMEEAIVDIDLEESIQHLLLMDVTDIVYNNLLLPNEKLALIFACYFAFEATSAETRAYVYKNITCEKVFNNTTYGCDKSLGWGLLGTIVNAVVHPLAGAVMLGHTFSSHNNCYKNAYDSYRLCIQK